MNDGHPTSRSLQHTHTSNDNESISLYGIILSSKDIDYLQTELLGDLAPLCLVASPTSPGSPLLALPLSDVSLATEEAPADKV